MVTVLAIVGVLVVLFVAAVVATKEGPVLRDAPADVADLDLPVGALRAQDVARVRFGVTIRGYRMSEVDEVLDRLADELTDRDRRIAELEGPPAGPPADPAEPTAPEPAWPPSP